MHRIWQKIKLNLNSNKNYRNKKHKNKSTMYNYTKIRHVKPGHFDNLYIGEFITCMEIIQLITCNESSGITFSVRDLRQVLWIVLNLMASIVMNTVRSNLCL